MRNEGAHSSPPDFAGQMELIAMGDALVPHPSRGDGPDESWVQSTRQPCKRRLLALCEEVRVPWNQGTGRLPMFTRTRGLKMRPLTVDLQLEALLSTSPSLTAVRGPVAVFAQRLGQLGMHKSLPVNTPLRCGFFPLPQRMPCQARSRACLARTGHARSTDPLAAPLHHSG